MMGVRARFIIMCVWGVEGVMKWRPVGEEVEAGEEQVMVKNDLAGGGWRLWVEDSALLRGVLLCKWGVVYCNVLQVSIL